MLIREQNDAEFSTNHVNNEICFTSIVKGNTTNIQKFLLEAFEMDCGFGINRVCSTQLR